MRRFDGRVAFVIGGAHGIGRAVAVRLAAEGAAVAVADVDSDAATATAELISPDRTQAVALACDIGDRGSVEAATGAAVTRFGGLDVLVNAAGGDLGEGGTDSSDDELWARQIDHTLTGALRAVRAALPHLLASPAGNVVTIGSVNGLAAFGSEPYSAAKAGLANLTQNLAARYGGRGVRFNLVAPGTVRTRVWDGRLDDLERLRRHYPLGRVGEPADIAAAVAFLASDDAAWITGIVLPVDGGALTGPAGAPSA